MVERSVVCLVIAIFAAPLGAANLLTNPSFDTGLTGWNGTPNTQPASWEKLDALQSPNSGSMMFNLTKTFGPVVGDGPYQCVNVTPGLYDAGVKMMIPGGQIAGEGFLSFELFTAPNCLDSSVFGGVSTVGVRAPSNGRFTPVALAQGFQIAAGTSSVRVHFSILNDVAGSLTAYFDDAFFGPSGGCVPSERVACLNGNRFAVRAIFIPPQGAADSAHVVQLTPDTAYMWFFASTNVEVTMKVLDACAVNGQQWVFTSGLTNVRVVITVTDTKTGVVKQYENPQGTPFAVVLDTSAFACP